MWISGFSGKAVWLFSVASVSLVEAIRAVLDGSDVVVLMPTGGLRRVRGLLCRRKVAVLPDSSSRAKRNVHRGFAANCVDAGSAFVRLPPFIHSERTQRQTDSLLPVEFPNHLGVSFCDGWAAEREDSLQRALRDAGAFSGGRVSSHRAGSPQERPNCVDCHRRGALH